MTEYLFYIIGGLAIVFALMVVFARSPINSVLAIISTMFCIAGEYILLNAQFLAVVHIIVYAGAIMVLFLFILMLLNLNRESEPQKSSLFKAIGVLTSGVFFIVLLATAKGGQMSSTNAVSDPTLGLVKNLGKSLFTDYVVPFEIASILFLAAMVGAVMIGKKDKDNHIQI